MGENHPALGAVDLDHLQRDALPDERLELPALRLRQIDVAARDETAYAEVHDEPALHLVHDHRVNHRARLERGLYPIPRVGQVGTLLAEQNAALVALDLHHVYVNAIADGDAFDGVAPGGQLLRRDESLGLRPHVDQHTLAVHAHDGALYDLAFRQRRHLREVEVVRLRRRGLFFGHRNPPSLV